MTHGHQDPEENLPEWLRALRRQQEAEQSSPDEPASPAEPDWLQEIRQRYRPDTGTQAKPPSEPEADGSSAAALEDTQPQLPLRLELPESIDEPGDDEPSFAEEPEADPLWPEEEREFDQGPFEDLAETQATPAFVQEEEDDEPASTPAFSIDPDELGSEPSWLDTLRTSEEFPREDARSEAMLPEGPEEEGPLAGLADVLPAGTPIGQIGTPVEFSTRLEVTGSQRQHAAVLQELLHSEQEAATETVERPFGNRWLGVLSSLMLCIAVLIPLLSGSQSASRPDPAGNPEVRSLFNGIDALPAGAPVLVAFDLQPAHYGEITPATVAALGHLLEKQARLVLLSTSQTGPALAEQLLADHFGNNPLISTSNYINLGYLSGDSAALRSLAGDPRAALLSGPARSNPWQTATLQPIQHLRDFALILVIASEGDQVRVWLEQVGPQVPGGLYAVTSAQAQPLLRTYLQSNPASLRGLVSGLQGAVLYERLRGDLGLGRQYWDAYSYGLGAIVLFILLGSLYTRLTAAQDAPNVKPGGSRGA